jgi:hypothetical protein
VEAKRVYGMLFAIIWCRGEAFSHFLPAQVSTDEACVMARRLAAEAGLLVGTSSGASVHAAIQVRPRPLSLEALKTALHRLSAPSPPSFPFGSTAPLWVPPKLHMGGSHGCGARGPI